MNVAGIDVSTRAVDVVKLPLDSDRATWHRFEARGRLAEDRLADMRDLDFRGAFWDDVCMVALEWPTGKFRTADNVLVAAGVVLAHIPLRLKPWWFRPSEWRAACGLPGNASKADVQQFFVNAMLDGGAPGDTAMWPQDACDAFCIAYACRAVNERAIHERPRRAAAS